MVKTGPANNRHLGQGGVFLRMLSQIAKSVSKCPCEKPEVGLGV